MARTGPTPAQAAVMDRLWNVANGRLDGVGAITIRSCVRLGYIEQVGDDEPAIAVYRLTLRGRGARTRMAA